MERQFIPPGFFQLQIGITLSWELEHNLKETDNFWWWLRSEKKGKSTPVVSQTGEACKYMEFKPTICLLKMERLL